MSVSDAPSNWWELLKQEDPAVFCDDASGRGPSLLFLEPERVIRAHTHAEVPAALAQLDEARRSGYWTAGYFEYEALDDLLAPPGPESPGSVGGPGSSAAPAPSTTSAAPASGLPLLWFGCYRSALRVTNTAGPDRESEQYSLERAPDGEATAWEQDAQARRAFEAGVRSVRVALEAGDCYQANLTARFDYTLSGSVPALYARLRSLQPAVHSALVRHDDRWILSLSPELFFRLDDSSGRTIAETRPIKGTSARRASAAADRESVRALTEDPKSRAENLMITDLLRNDLGRISKPGAVATGPLFSVESLPGLHQMYSIIRSELTGAAAESLYATVLPALFPCGSVTGAPKLAARALLRRLEGRERGVYTGAIGYAMPLHAAARAGAGAELPVARFNVAIRTFDIHGDRACFQSGCGIVWDSDPQAESAELLLKRSFVEAAVDGFALIETLRLADGRYTLLLAHLRRLSRSARAFAFADFSLRGVLADLRRTARERPSGCFRVRLTLDRDLKRELGASPLLPAPSRGSLRATEGLRLQVSPHTVRAGDPYRRHKTTERHLYDEELARVNRQGADDVLFANESGFLVETAIANIIVLLDGVWTTPPVDCGALPGTALAALEGRRPGRIRRRKIELREIKRAKRVLICNSVRGLRRVAQVLGATGQPIYLERRSQTGTDAQLRATGDPVAGTLRGDGAGDRLSTVP